MSGLRGPSGLLPNVVLLIGSLGLCILLFPPQWYPDGLRRELSALYGAPDGSNSSYQVETQGTDLQSTEEFCPEDLLGWRQAQSIEGVDVSESLTCSADNPYTVASFVRGTNNVSLQTLMAAGLTPDAVEKSDDLDGDGDPDVIRIRLEVVELNGGSPDTSQPSVQFAIAPGVLPGLWVFAPKTFGMATENFASNQAKDLLRPPSPTIRIEQGDRVEITLENSHYLGHTIHFHGVDHPFLDANGEGNDGVPITSELPVQPGSARTYNLQPRQSGTMFYHCHVQPQAHVMMGLQGLFIVEENRPNNWVQTLNIGAGHVRVPSQAVTENYSREYDLHFTDLDTELNSIVQQSNIPHEIEDRINRDYNITDSSSDFFLLNGRSFPYTFRESLIVTKPDERIKLRIVNGGSEGLSLHTHGHKATATHMDGIALKPEARVTRDVFWISSAQRLDLELETKNDGLHSYGSGVWLLHDHQARAVTNNGIGPGGNVGAIVYEEFLDQKGWPMTYGEDWGKFFNPDFYRRQSLPEGNDNSTLTFFLFLRLLGFGIFFALVFRSINEIVRLTLLYFSR